MVEGQGVGLLVVVVVQVARHLVVVVVVAQVQSFSYRKGTYTMSIDLISHTTGTPTEQCRVSMKDLLVHGALCSRDLKTLREYQCAQ